MELLRPTLYLLSQHRRRQGRPEGAAGTHALQESKQARHMYVLHTHLFAPVIYAGVKSQA